MTEVAVRPAPHIDQTMSRVLPADYRGDILIWDIDKTYLDTHFSSWRGLARIPFELAIDKRTIPGAVPVLRALRRGPGNESALVPLFFVSGSPPQLRRVIERRMMIDGVDFDGITFKDQLKLLLSGRPSGITAQVGYKLTALLLYKKKLPDGAHFLLFGDDVERDAEIFTLFGDICAGLSTNGLDFKIPGRVGDSPITGAGGYCDNDVGGAVGTGNGDVMMRFLPSYQAVENMRRGMSPADAAKDALERIRKKGYKIGGALIAVNKKGEFGAAALNYADFPFAVRNASTDELKKIKGF